MKSLPAWATGARAEELQDWEDGYKNYRRQRARSHNAQRIRQFIRKERVQEIDGASVEMVDGVPTILGEHWFDAWITVFAYLGGEGRFKEIKPPKEWLAEKVLQ